MSRAMELIRRVASPLSLCKHTWCPGQPPTDPPQFQNWTCWIKHCREAHLATCDVRVSVRGRTLVSESIKKKKKKRRGRESCYRVPFLCLHRGLLSCKLIGGEENSVKRTNAESQSTKAPIVPLDRDCSGLYCLKCLFSFTFNTCCRRNMHASY